jgi:A/G-specific adenine glycosylase
MHEYVHADAGRKVAEKAIQEFRDTMFAYYREHGRRLPWRYIDSPYRILVSEFMLQQTQVDRVLTKYDPFISRFPDINAVAHASLRDVLAEWQGLGYNRRAANLHKAAQKVVHDFNGMIPDCADTLQALPGVGPSTAGAVVAFAFNKPAVFIETNIRRVFIHFFFPGADKVSDKQIFPLVERALDRTDPRSWYYALMDYGVMLASREANPNRRSAHYHRQSRFENSDRQIRGMILKALVAHPALALEELVQSVPREPERTRIIVDRLQKEGILTRKEDVLSISSGRESSARTASKDSDPAADRTDGTDD